MSRVYRQSRLLTWFASRWRQQFIHPVMEQITNVTHRQMLIVSPLLAFHHTTVNLGNHDLDVHNTVMGVYCKLGLQADN